MPEKPAAPAEPAAPAGRLLAVAHGIDLVHCPRIVRVYEQHGERFLERVYTAAERAYCLDARDPIPRLAGRFAAKEAVMKMLGTGWRGGVDFTDIETLPDPAGRPLVTLRGVSAGLARTLGITQVLLSISHSGEYAVASAIGLGRG
ncbi:MAG: holo-ACP synthase [Planctomycetota bacterium]